MDGVPLSAIVSRLRCLPTVVHDRRFPRIQLQDSRRHLAGKHRKYGPEGRDPLPHVACFNSGWTQAILVEPNARQWIREDA